MVGIQQVTLIQDRVGDLAGMLEVGPRHDWASSFLAAASSAAMVASQVGNAPADLNASRPASVELLILIQALSGKWTSMASRHWLSGIRKRASLLHGTCSICRLPSTIVNTVPLNSSSSG